MVLDSATPGGRCIADIATNIQTLDGMESFGLKRRRTVSYTARGAWCRSIPRRTNGGFLRSTWATAGSV